MAAATLNLTIEKGATFILPLRLQNNDLTYVDLTGYSGRMQVRGTMADATPALDISGVQFTFDNIGHCTVKVSDTLTTALTISVGVYDLEIVAPSGDVTRLLQGKVKINPNVTRGVGVSP
jgi:hypothetical protein